MLGHLIYTYDRVEDARIQQELSTHLNSQILGGVHIVHTYSGGSTFGYEPYLEAKLIPRKNRGHYRGAVDLINAGLQYFSDSDLDIRYVLVTAADTWIVQTEFLANLISEMEANEKVLATSSWVSEFPAAPAGFALDFFVIDLQWNRHAQLFPLDYDDFFAKYADILALRYVPPFVEVALQYGYHKHFLKSFEDNDVWTTRDRHFRRIIEREPTHIRDNDNARMMTGIYHSHDAEKKKALLTEMGLDCGPYCHRLLTANDLSYFSFDSAKEQVPVLAPDCYGPRI